MKANLRGKIIAAASLKKKKQCQKKLLDLQNQLKLSEDRHAQGQNTKMLQQIKKIRNEINIIYTQEIEKKLFTRQKYYENGPKFTKLLARKLRKKEADSTIYKIQDQVEAITRLKVNKSPGSDGFTAEGCKAFRRELMPVLLTTCNWALKKALTPPTWKEAIIFLIQKEGKDRTECGSHRPISILNVDYRIHTSIMARRMEKFHPNQIHYDQTGFIHMR